MSRVVGRARLSRRGSQLAALPAPALPADLRLVRFLQVEWLFACDDATHKRVRIRQSAGHGGAQVGQQRKERGRD